MSKYNQEPNSNFDLPAETHELLSKAGRGKRELIMAAVNAVVAEPQTLSKALYARLLTGAKVTKPVRVTTTVPAETREQIEKFSEVTGLSKNQVVALALEAHLTGAT